MEPQQEKELEKTSEQLIEKNPEQNDKQLLELLKYQEQQPIINIGMLGHVANGKSTIVKCITGKSTQQHSDEKKQNITIKLGYSNGKIFSCPTCPAPQKYQPSPSSTLKLECNHCGTLMKLERHISFVDCPGHNMLTTTMLSGTSVMNCAILVESVANEKVPSPQTIEHLGALELSGINDVLVCMNKLDLVHKMEANRKISDLKEFLKGTIAEKSPVIPIVANRGLPSKDDVKHGSNIDILCEYICRWFPLPTVDLISKPKMIIIRSFNTNKPQTDIKELAGGIVGGSLLKGILKLGDRIEIRPGVYKKDIKDNWVITPIVSTITNMQSEQHKLTEVIAGGLIGLSLLVDPSLTINDCLAGHTLGLYHELPHVYSIIDIEYQSMNILVSRSKLKVGDVVVINHNASNVSCKIINISREKKKRFATLELITRPICASIKDRICLCKKDDGWKIIGVGSIVSGNIIL
jgi:translation initiation factor 2 subunit 3